jgi:RNA recognition motif-containing protein
VESTADQAEKTVFVGNLNIHTTEKDLREHFEKQGLKVRDVQIIMDKRKISKG